ncbi:hypothetical protein [Meiothermus cerbereus]|uniref:hypothetical protein n=1 Tax=Meiothermus cerbereus TaxID=65552 RepID=UPI00048A43A3|nr:hypothetical protein [Meiothermus cerbereus]
MIRLLARALREHAQEFSRPERHPELGPFCTYLQRRYKKPLQELPPEAWEEGLLEYVAEIIAEGWDEYGAPSAARSPEGHYLASAETPEGPLTVTAESKREAYRKARREWARRLLG